MNRKSFSYSIPCSKDRLKEIRQFVEEVLESTHSLNQVQINSIVLAVDEVCANLMIHSHDCNPNERIEVSIFSDKQNGITFEIIDHGEAFDITNYHEPSLHEIVKKKKKGGMGLMLVNRIMDSVEFKRSSNNRNVCTLKKKFR